MSLPALCTRNCAAATKIVLRRHKAHTNSCRGRVKPISSPTSTNFVLSLVVRSPGTLNPRLPISANQTSPITLSLQKFYGCHSVKLNKVHHNLSIGSMSNNHVTRLSTPAEYQSFLSRFDTLLVDCDGVLWSGNTLLPNILQTLFYLRKRNKKLIFVSNNSTKSRRMYTSKFTKFGIPVTEDEIFGSSYSAAIYLSRVLKFPKDKKVYVLGERGVEEELDAEGIQYCGGTDPNDRMELEEEDYDSIRPDESVGAVLCGLDHHISYKKLAKGLTYLRQSPDVLFLATNTDSTYPTHNTLFPGAGSTTTAPLQFATKRTVTTCGKPSQTMMDAIFARYDLHRERTCMVGDRLDTDIKFGLAGKLGGTLLVLSGVSSLEDCEREGIWPKYVMDGLGDLGVLEGKME